MNEQSTPPPLSAQSSQPAKIAAPPMQQQFIMTIGDIGITPTLVVTPNGTGPLAGSQWICTDMSRTESRMPATAVVLAILFFLVCLLGLLFLLMKEHVTTGYVEVSVRTGDIYHKVQIPVSQPGQVGEVRQQVSQIQAMVVRTQR